MSYLIMTLLIVVGLYLFASALVLGMTYITYFALLAEGRRYGTAPPIPWREQAYLVLWVIPVTALMVPGNFLIDLVKGKSSS